MLNSSSQFDPRKGLDLPGRVLLRLRSIGVDRQILSLLQTACEQALSAESIVLSKVEKDRLIQEIANSIVRARPERP